MRNTFMGFGIALIIALLVGCADSYRHRRVKRVAKPHVSAVWVPAHHGPAGRLVPGHWR